MKQSKSRIRCLAIISLALIVTSVRGDDGSETNYSLAALNEMKGSKLVEQYEKRFAEFPDNTGYRLNLSLMYALSSVLDHSLAPDEAQRRKILAVQLVEPEFRKELSQNTPDEERALYMGFILAQVYLTLSETEKCEEVFKSIAMKFPADAEIKAALTNAENELKVRVEQGYPHDSPNPWSHVPHKEETDSSGKSELPGYSK
jgi:hypothetical protein